MTLALFYALLFSVLPITELRVGLPLGILYALENEVSISLIFATIVILNILVIFFIFWFLDNLHNLFMRSETYQRGFEKLLKRLQKRVDKFEKKYETLGFLALVLFVGIPLPGTGAWTGCLIAWILGLERKRSILAIATGVLLAGILILLASLGVITLFN